MLENLTAEFQGTLYAVTEQSVLVDTTPGAGGYAQWVVDVPYRVMLDGKRRAQIDVVMRMRIRRVSLLWRDAGIWVDSYIVKPRGQQ